MKSEDNKNLLIPDPYASRVVKNIFQMRLEGASALRIANELNRLGILSPLAYKKNHGLPYAKKGYADSEDCKWSATTIIRILQDETYTGTLVQGRQAELALFVLVMQQKWHNQSLLEALWNRYNMHVRRTHNRNLENCIPFTRHITVQEAMQRHAETSRKGTAVICFAPIMQSVTTRQAELALFVSAK